MDQVHLLIQFLLPSRQAFVHYGFACHGSIADKILMRLLITLVAYCSQPLKLFAL
jgi:hypothetical protein